MTDNFDTVKQFIQITEPDFDLDDDKFYTVEIIRRRKDNPDQHGSRMHSPKNCIKVYYINKLADFDTYRDEIIKLCEVFNARAYVAVNCKSYEHVMKAAMVEFATRIASNNFNRPQSIFQSCTGKYQNSKKKIWIIDIDAEDAIKTGVPVSKLVEIAEKAVEKSAPYRKHIITVPSKSGEHVVAYGFNMVQFEKETIGFIERDSIKRNNFIVLYAV